MSDGKRTKNPARTNMARYSNYFEIGHNSYEFLIDFGQFQPEAANVLLHTRIIVGPTHAKLLEHMLRDSVQRYESENGVIPDVSETLDLTDTELHPLPDLKPTILGDDEASQRSGGKDNKLPHRKRQLKKKV